MRLAPNDRVLEDISAQLGAELRDSSAPPARESLAFQMLETSSQRCSRRWRANFELLDHGAGAYPSGVVIRVTAPDRAG